MVPVVKPTVKPDVRGLEEAPDALRGRLRGGNLVHDGLCLSRKVIFGQYPKAPNAVANAAADVPTLQTLCDLGAWVRAEVVADARLQGVFIHVLSWVVEIVLGEVERVVIATLEECKVCDACNTSIFPVLRLDAREGILGDLVPAPELAVHFKKVAMSDAQGRFGLSSSGVGRGLFFNLSALHFPRNDSVSAEATVLVNVNTSSVGGRDSFLRLASNIGVEIDNGSLLVTLLDNDENGARRLEAKLFWILARVSKSDISGPQALAIAVEACVEDDSVRTGQRQYGC
jgi:hypothetical protein